MSVYTYLFGQLEGINLLEERKALTDFDDSVLWNKHMVLNYSTYTGFFFS